MKSIYIVCFIIVAGMQVNAQLCTTPLMNYSPPLVPHAYTPGNNANVRTITKVYTYLVVPEGMSTTAQESDSIKKAMKDIQAWYQVTTGGITFELAYPDSVIIYNGENDRTYYDVDWWGRLLTEIQSNGVPVWTDGYIFALWIKGVSGNGIGLGAQWCGEYCGVSMASVEGWPGFNPGTYCYPCPGSSGSSGTVWPCVPRGTMAHELGHAFGLPHPDDPNASYYAISNPVAFHSVMRAHWNFPYWLAVSPDDNPWGLLSVERQVLMGNSVLKQDIDLIQVYPSAPLVNLPDIAPLPDAGFTIFESDDMVSFTNSSSGASLYYWTFGDGTVSNDINPAHTYLNGGNFMAKLRASNSESMMDIDSAAIQITDVHDPDASDEDLLQIFPNPTSGSLSVSIRDQIGNGMVMIFDVTGRSIFQLQLPDNISHFKVNLENCPSGVYFLELRRDIGIVRKIISKQ